MTAAEPVTIFDSNDHPDTEEGGYQVAVALDQNGAVHSVAIIDHQMGDLVEVPPEVALLIARAIQDKVKDPKATSH